MPKDQLFQKRKKLKKEDLERKKASQSERKRALIICEDSVSTPAYFRKLINHFGLSAVDIQIYGEGTSPLTLAKKGEAYLQEDSQFEHVFFVFDKDMHEDYDKALDKIDGLNKRKQYKKISIDAITSNPCFELWLLLHVSYSDKPYVSRGPKSSADCLIEDLKKHESFKNYQKGDRNCRYFDSIQGHMDNAVTHAEALRKNAINRGESNEHHINPSTFIHKLVSILKSMIPQSRAT